VCFGKLQSLHKATIQCPNLRSIELLAVTSLRSLEVSGNATSIIIQEAVALASAKIDCPQLQLLRVDGACVDESFVTQFTTHSTLQELELTRCGSIGRVQLNAPQLISVTLADCQLLGLLRVTGTHVERIFVGGCYGLVDMYLDTDKLQGVEFAYHEGYHHTELPSAGAFLSHPQRLPPRLAQMQREREQARQEMMRQKLPTSPDATTTAVPAKQWHIRCKTFELLLTISHH